jgi:hypothetical protein
VVRTDLLKPLNDLAYLVECAALDYNGELRSELSILCQVIQQRASGYEAHEVQSVLPKLQSALEAIHSRQKSSATSILVGVSRDWWALVKP